LVAKRAVIETVTESLYTRMLSLAFVAMILVTAAGILLAFVLF
jgi:hypothetical protein